MRIAELALVGLGLAAAAKPADTAGAEGAPAAIARRSLAVRVLAGWHPASAEAARRCLREYGVPDEVGYGRMTWRDARPWTRVVVREAVPARSGEGELAVIEQAVDYPLGAARGREVARFGLGVRYDSGREELVAVSEREELNVLRLNLADDVLGGRLAPAAARAELAAAAEPGREGRTPPAMARLRFLPVLVSRP